MYENWNFILEYETLTDLPLSSKSNPKIRVGSWYFMTRMILVRIARDNLPEYGSTFISSTGPVLEITSYELYRFPRWIGAVSCFVTMSTILNCFFSVLLLYQVKILTYLWSFLTRADGGEISVKIRWPSSYKTILIKSGF